MKYLFLLITIVSFNSFSQNILGGTNNTIENTKSKENNCTFSIYDGNGKCDSDYIVVSNNSCCIKTLPFYCPNTNKCYATCEQANEACNGSVIKGSSNSIISNDIINPTIKHETNNNQNITNSKSSVQYYENHLSKNKTTNDVICYLKNKIFRCQNPQIQVEYTYNTKEQTHGLWHTAIKTSYRTFFPIDQIILHAWNENGPLADLRVRDASGNSLWWHVVGPSIETGFFNFYLIGENKETNGCSN